MSDLRISGAPRQLLPGPAAGSCRARFTGGELSLFFSAELRWNDIWSLPVAKSGSAAGEEMTRLTSDTSLPPGIETRFSLSPDGSELLFPSKRSGEWKIWRKRLHDNGREEPATLGVGADGFPIHVPDGSGFAFRREFEGAQTLHIDRAGATQVVRGSAGEPAGWNRDGTQLLFLRDKELLLADVVGHRFRSVFLRDGWRPRHAALSPDGGWIALAVNNGKPRLQGFVAPFNADRLHDVSQWLEVLNEPDPLAISWSAAGDGVYYFSTRDGFRCLWFRSLDRTAKVLGEPRCVRHFHGYQQYPLNGSVIAVSRDRLAFVLAEHQSNIWIARIPQ
jgi:hypothetical protein